ncbi:flagellar filament capping protein FliD [Pseudocitrobacter cyperus]|uniref:Flagellar hook-associated protein 2 n=1 Tax=Pseudocitrobacter cyperus TaxID=3112843 RepID=A0ABV0HQQ8_9ENTR
MAATNFLGVGSGLPFDEWLTNERKAMSQRLNPYLQKQSTYKGQISAWGSISSSLSTLKDNLGKLEDEGFNGVSVSDNKTFKATASSEAMPNSYSIAVKQLAKAHQVGVTQESRTKPIGSDKAHVKISMEGSAKPLEVELEADETSLDQIAKKINAQNGDVIAEVITNSDKEHQLVLTSRKTGTTGEMTIDVTGDPKVIGAFASSKTVTDAEDAIIIVNNKETTRSSNTIKDLITGVTLELREVSEKDTSDPSDPDKLKTESLTITEDTSKVKTLIEEFVKNYNSYLSTAASATKYTAPERDNNSDALVQPDPTNGALFSDGSLRRLTSQLKSTISGNYPDAGELIQSLGSLGITVKFDGKTGDERTGTLGTLSIDNKKLDAALKDNPKEVEALFLGKGEKPGIKERMEGIFDTYLGDEDAIKKEDGVIETALKSLREQDSRIGKQITAMERRIEEAMLRSEKEYQRLDKIMSDMSSMSNRLQQSLLELSQSM